jgi:hypothetical protein
MALIAKDLCTIGTGGNNSLHMYYTNDADTTVETSGYFLSAYKSLKVGDFILANLDMDGTPESKIYRVATCTSEGVTVGFPTLS